MKWCKDHVLHQIVASLSKKGKINRKCSFKECLAYHDGKKIRYFWGESKGNLTEKIIGKDREDKWSALWYIFVPEGYQKTLAQMAPEERQAREYGTDYTCLLYTSPSPRD